MKRFGDLKIGTALMLSYAVIIALFVASIGVAFYAVNRNADMTREFYDRPYEVTKNAIQLRCSLEETSGCLGQLVTGLDEASERELLEKLDRLSVERTSCFDAVSGAFTADPALLTQFSKANEDLVVLRSSVVDAAERGDYARALDLYTSQYLPQKEVTTDLADGIVRTAESVASEFVTKAQELETQTIAILGATALVALALILIMWRVITRAVAEPTRAMEQTARRIAEGDLTAHVDYASSNELGGLAAAMNDTVIALRATVERMGEAAEQVALSSTQMSEGSQSIAQGSAEQALSIEELASNVQSIERVVGENADSMSVANDGAANVLSAVEGGNDQIVRTAQVIGQIRDNTHNISHLANTIEDISFQTNILALNASVEAARAGEAGRGFSIVAEEIRRLAAQVSEASQEADDLASRTIASIVEGDGMIEAAVDHMGGAVQATEHVKEMMAAIAQASAQQLEAVAQIRESMDRLSDVVQENSAAAEESAVIAEDLSEQASGLKGLIDRFDYARRDPAEKGR